MGTELKSQMPRWRKQANPWKKKKQKNKKTKKQKTKNKNKTKQNSNWVFMDWTKTPQKNEFFGKEATLELLGIYFANKNLPIQHLLC